MTTINAGFWIRVQDNQVVAVWDTTPPRETQDGWREAVEVMPDVIANREYVTHHHFDLGVSPAQIIWNKTEMTVEDRKNGLVGQAKGEFQRIVNEQAQLQLNDTVLDVYNAKIVADAKTALEARLTQIAGAVTHEDVDAL